MPLNSTPRKLPTYEDQEVGTFPGNLPEAILGITASVVIGVVMAVRQMVTWIYLEIQGRRERRQKQNVDRPNVWMM